LLGCGFLLSVRKPGSNPRSHVNRVPELADFCGQVALLKRSNAAIFPSGVDHRLDGSGQLVRLAKKAATSAMQEVYGTYAESPVF
jgi:hypothetical protein